MTLLCTLYLTSGSLDLLINLPIRFIFRILAMLCIKYCKVINAKVFKTRIGSLKIKSSLLLLLLLSRFSHVRLCATHRWQPTRLLCPWDSPSKNTGVSCHFLLHCMKVKSESEFTQSSPTLSDLMDCSPPGFSIHGIFQARVLEWGATAFSCTVLTNS